ncbi:MAG: FAD-binding protein [Bacteroidales bacterium]|nr:FAD-binding protein [Bacteroidales bacterium]
MQLDIDLTPEQYLVPSELTRTVARKLCIAPTDVAHVVTVRRSLDSRHGHVRYHATLQVYNVGEPYSEPDYSSPYRDCTSADPVVIVGAGPAGLFAALRALELGLRPIIIDRGKPVDERKYDIVAITRQGLVNPDSNWCFGEGGAGTYSDGKLFTRSTKRGDVAAVLRKFVEHGADPSIMVDAHAHIGTDRLSGIISRMRQTITEHGGHYLFGTRVVDLKIEGGCVKGVVTADGNTIDGIAVILATGHSARDIYELFNKRQWALEAKPFALGVRVEHPQELINRLQYHTNNPSSLLPPAAYSLVTQVGGHGVFSFCMCPGGVIVPAATAPRQQVVNGMSNSRRNSPYANSGIAVTVNPADVPQYTDHGALALLRFQQDVEQRMHVATGREATAPAQRLTDFCANQASSSINPTGYMASTAILPLHELLPPFVTEALRKAFSDFDAKMHGFLTSQANLLAVESRTSSPVRIVRDNSGVHPQLPGLYPCGEGAGYAGGIVSSALDGIRAIEHVSNVCSRHDIEPQ